MPTAMYPNQAAYGHRRARLHEVITPAGTTTFLDYDAYGRPLKTRDPNTIETTFTYWPRGWIKTQTTQGAVYSYAYDRTGALTQITDPEGRITRYYYDSAHRLIKIEDPLGNLIQYTLDPNGNRTAERVYDVNMNLIRSQFMTYDEQNRLERVTNADGTFREYTYDDNGNLLSSTDENGQTVDYEYDELNRMEKTILRLDGPDHETEYSYDAHDNLTLAVDGLGHATGYFYDDFGNVLFVNAPDTGQSEFQYDKANNLIQKTDAEYTTTSYTYDAMNRLTTIDYPSDTDITYTYDSPSVSHGMGRITGMTDATGTYAWHYDAHGRLAAKHKTVMGTAYTTAYGYDSAGVLNQITYPGGRIIGYGQDSIGRVQSVTQNGSRLAENAAYKPFGPMHHLDLSSGIALSREFNPRNQLTRMTAGTVMELEFDRHFNGQIRIIRGKALPVMAEQTETLTMVPGTNQIQSVGTRQAEYDLNGNMTNLGSRTFIYNDNQRLVRVTENTQTLGHYIYNGLGQRVIKTAGGATTVFHYDAAGNLIAESSPNGTLSAEYVYMNGERLAKINSTTGAVFHYINDHLGTPVKMTDQNGLVVWSADYMPFGEAYVDSQSTQENPFRYPGQYYDEETGLHYNMLRYYDPELGRYLEADPIGQAGGFNLYAYASGDPANRVDPYGLSARIHFYTMSIEFVGADFEDIECWYEYVPREKMCCKRKESYSTYCQIAPKNYYKEAGTVRSFRTSASVIGKSNLSFGSFAKSWVSNVTVGFAAYYGMAKILGLGSNNISRELQYAPRVRERGVEDPASHNFPYSFDKEILSTKPIPKNNGYSIFQKPGTMNGKNGVFEIGVTKNGVIDHRFFRPNR